MDKRPWHELAGLRPVELKIVHPPLTYLYHQWPMFTDNMISWHFYKDIVQCHIANPLPKNSNFWWPWRGILKELFYREKMLVSILFSFSLKGFFPFEKHPLILLSVNALNLDKSKILSIIGKEIMLPTLESISGYCKWSHCLKTNRC